VWKITILHQKILFFSIAEGGAKIVGVFRVKSHDFTQKKHIFSNFWGGGARAGCAPLWIRTCKLPKSSVLKGFQDYSLC
jgi:hypothetical protein